MDRRSAAILVVWLVVAGCASSQSEDALVAASESGTCSTGADPSEGSRTLRYSDGAGAVLDLRVAPERTEAVLTIDGEVAARLAATGDGDLAEVVVEYAGPAPAVVQLQAGKDRVLTGSVAGEPLAPFVMSEAASGAVPTLVGGGPLVSPSPVEGTLAKLLVKALTATEEEMEIATGVSALTFPHLASAGPGLCASCLAGCTAGFNACFLPNCPAYVVIPVIGPLVWLLCERRNNACTAMRRGCGAACFPLCDCPVTCGAGCCARGETCLNASRALCCPAGSRPCGDVCLTLPTESCVAGAPCPTERACLDRCCGNNEFCDTSTGTCLPRTLSCESWEWVCRAGFPTVEICCSLQRSCASLADGTAACR
jgi:hypothetical protein